MPCENTLRMSSRVGSWSVEVPARLERILELCCRHGVAACSECVNERAGFVVAGFDSADTHGPGRRSLSAGLLSAVRI